MPARISFYRPTGQSRRSARQAHDHDVFEGLPVRRWHREWVAVGKPAAAMSTPQPELPLPKDAHLMSSTSQGLLAAARAGSTNEETPKPREAVQPEPLFRTKRWVRIAKELEPPEPIYLAKVPDAPGKKGEEMPVNGGMGEGVGGQMPRRRAPPPPKKRSRRPGRKPGFRKSVTFVEGQQTQQTPQVSRAPQAEQAEQTEQVEQTQQAEKTPQAEQTQQVQQTQPETPLQEQESVEVEMLDADPATKTDPVPESIVARELNKAEKVTEPATMLQKSEEGPSHSLPSESPGPLVVDSEENPVA